MHQGARCSISTSIAVHLSRAAHTQTFFLNETLEAHETKVVLLDRNLSLGVAGAPVGCVASVFKREEGPSRCVIAAAS
jgi:hypothetical protein